IYRDYESMLAEQAGRIDLCLIPTGIQWHARMTIAALRAGAHVLVEKPLAGSLAEVAEIQAAERATDRWVAVGFQDLYCPVNQWLKAELCAHAIGQLRSVRLLGLWPRPNSYFSRNHWAGRLHADGAPVRDSLLNNAFAHFVNLCLFFAGDAPRRSAAVVIDSAELLRAHSIETFDTSVVRAHSPDGVDFWIGVSHTSQRTLEPEIQITGTEGRIEWHHGIRCTIETHRGRREERALPEIESTRQTMFRDVLIRLRDPSALICGTDLAEPHTRFIEQVHAASTPMPVPREMIEWASSPADHRSWPVVRGLENALLQARTTGTTLSSAGFTVAPTPV
ncbi:MAG TPA: Gfo/Idh/MocA family oxidoreductase, partial [Candidatus Synoicihabitans sp.]|nr:Gfo/Idh/MocA family oxidoreductase [Candidatus Synoicihabitans sp.]